MSKPIKAQKLRILVMITMENHHQPILIMIMMKLMLPTIPTMKKKLMIEIQMIMMGKVQIQIQMMDDPQ